MKGIQEIEGDFKYYSLIFSPQTSSQVNYSILLSRPTQLLAQVNNGNTRAMFEICSKLTIKTPGRHERRHSGVVIVNFEQISQIALVFLLLTLNK